MKELEEVKHTFQNNGTTHLEQLYQTTNLKEQGTPYLNSNEESLIT